MLRLFTEQQHWDLAGVLGMIFFRRCSTKISLTYSSHVHKYDALSQARAAGSLSVRITASAVHASCPVTPYTLSHAARPRERRLGRGYTRGGNRNFTSSSSSSSSFWPFQKINIVILQRAREPHKESNSKHSGICVFSRLTNNLMPRLTPEIRRSSVGIRKKASAPLCILCVHKLDTNLFLITSELMENITSLSLCLAPLAFSLNSPPPPSLGCILD